MTPYCQIALVCVFSLELQQKSLEWENARLVLIFPLLPQPAGPWELA